MYLTQMRLNPTRLTTKRLLTSPQITHALVLGSFSGGEADPEGRVLWRLDQGPSHDLQLYVVSPGKPDLTGAVEQAGWPTQAAWQTADYSPFLGRLELGQRWRFRLTANPVRSARPEEWRGKQGRGKVSPHRTVDQQVDWLVQRSADWGFTIPTNDLGSLEVVLRGRHTSTFRRASQGPARVAITLATFDGVLDVTDADLLRRSLAHGMGRAKGYGCGLMTLAPLS